MTDDQFICIMYNVHTRTLCFLKTIPSATCIHQDRWIVLSKKAYTEGTVFTKPVVSINAFLKK